MTSLKLYVAVYDVIKNIGRCLRRY